MYLNYRDDTPNERSCVSLAECKAVITENGKECTNRCQNTSVYADIELKPTQKCGKSKCPEGKFINMPPTKCVSVCDNDNLYYKSENRCVTNKYCHLKNTSFRIQKKDGLIECSDKCPSNYF